jgi:hypothetical protein
MIDLAALQARFPHHKIKSQPTPGCTCTDGVRTEKSGNQFPCLCVCMSAPENGQPEYRNEVRKALASAAKGALDELKGK